MISSYTSMPVAGQLRLKEMAIGLTLIIRLK